MMISTICRNILSQWRKPVILLVWLFLWQFASDWLGREIFLVSPIRTVETLIVLAQEQEFWYSIGLTLLRIMSGFLQALFVGSVLAFCGWRFPLVHDFLSPVLHVMKAMPVASFIILALLWVGGSYVSILCAFIMVMPIVYVNFYQGLCGVDQKLLEVGQMFALSRRQLAQRIYIPSLKPYMVSACTVGIGFCWKSGVAAEVIGLPNHTIGMQLYSAKVNLMTPELFAWTLVIILLSVSIEKVVLFLLQQVLR